MNILLRSSPETSPKIPTFRKQIKTLQTKTQGVLTHSLLSLFLSPSLHLPPTSLCFSTRTHTPLLSLDT